MKALKMYFTFLLFIPHYGFAESVNLIVVEKRNRQLTLFSGAKIVRQYLVALGGSPDGAKQCQGDRKTPEGHYKISGRNKNSAYHRSLRVSYPNQKDILRAKQLKCSPGGDIMIHGLPNGKAWIGAAHRKHDWTDGCIALTDEEIEEVWRLVPDGTVVEIKP